MDDYKKLLSKSKSELEQSEQVKNKIFKSTIFFSKIKLYLGILTFVLLIIPVSYIITFLYYAFGTPSTTIMDVTSQTLYVTEPNTALEELEFDMSFSPFSMTLDFEQYKTIGQEDYKANSYSLKYTLGNLTSKSVDSSLERVIPKNPTETNPWLIHPANNSEVNSSREWEILRGLPEETVVEAYISLHELIDVDEAKEIFQDVTILWAAVNTGIEETNLSKDGNVVSPIGYPVQRDETYWSPFRGEKPNQEVFMDILNFISQHEDLANEVSSSKNLDLQERIQFIQNNGIETYGFVVTGPKNAIESLQDLTIIKDMKVGEVKLWNWSN
ncbi:anti-sigma factor [Alkalihalobacillus trypoxylicola]|uniref:Anti-sigma factor n=1 Tax=Alkalihalobacillus trypoxylicola TaxID=519424 RepID=A0A162EP93_9BACI|nr:anti-sigma factor [Alkalihalobacillus trypoxylicola]KYG33399.1 anti-sigma factor [Alkalihalobacillus trypoxylicola]